MKLYRIIKKSDVPGLSKYFKLIGKLNKLLPTQAMELKGKNDHEAINIVSGLRDFMRRSKVSYRVIRRHRLIYIYKK